jgi:DNA invertase Pin-like site-specific DNA recombinase
MNACIYARTSRQEKLHTTTKIEKQVAFCMELARSLNLTVQPEHVYTDVELTGDLLPACWANDGEPARPALAAMIAAIEEQDIRYVIVRRLEKLGTTSAVLCSLLEFFNDTRVSVVCDRETIRNADEPSAQFAWSILKPRVVSETQAEREQRELERARKREEIERLKDKIARLEAELAAR